MSGHDKVYTAYLGKTKYVLEASPGRNMVITRTNLDGEKKFYFPVELIEQLVKDRLKEKISGIVDKLL